MPSFLNKKLHPQKLSSSIPQYFFSSEERTKILFSFALFLSLLHLFLSLERDTALCPLHSRVNGHITHTLSLSLKHTYTPTHTLSRNTQTRTHSHSLCLIQTHTQTHTHTRTRKCIAHTFNIWKKWVPRRRYIL